MLPCGVCKGSREMRHGNDEFIGVPTHELCREMRHGNDKYIVMPTHKVCREMRGEDKKYVGNT